MTLDLATLFKSADRLLSTGPCRYASDLMIKSSASSNGGEFPINSSNFVSLCDFGVTYSYKTLETTVKENCINHWLFEQPKELYIFREDFARFLEGSIIFD